MPHIYYSISLFENNTHELNTVIITIDKNTKEQISISKGFDVKSIIVLRIFPNV